MDVPIPKTSLLERTCYSVYCLPFKLFALIQSYFSVRMGIRLRISVRVTNTYDLPLRRDHHQPA